MLGKRLMHHRVVTLQIVEVHINVIKVLRVIDPATNGLLDIMIHYYGNKMI